MEDKYIHYEALDFAQDDDFIHWVKQTDKANPVFWDSWQQAHPEKLALIQEAKYFVTSIVVRDIEPSEEQVENIWQKINTATPTHQPKVRSLQWLRYVAAAASLAGLGWLLFTWVMLQETTVLANRGEKVRHILPDGSTITLNAESSINYRHNQWSKIRTIELEGEAFFEVIKGKPFNVLTPKGTVEVLGTTFNVEARDTRLEVACYTGKVKVVIEKITDTFTLLPFKKVRFEEVGLSADTTSFDAKDTLNWRNGIFDFQEENVGRIIAALERQYNVNIDYPERIVDDSALSFFFDTKNPIDSALNLFGTLKGLSWRRNGEMIVFKQ
jgi:ferric-dicitrate binding protein FerR (iron transport regulator)